LVSASITPSTGFCWLAAGQGVPGVAQSPLSDADTAAVLNWMIKTLSDPPPERFDAFTAEEVARSRHQPLADVSAARAKLLSSPGH